MPPTRAAARNTWRGLSLAKKASHRCLIGQIELGVRARHEIAIAGALEPAHERRADQTAMAGDVDAFRLGERHRGYSW